MTDYESNLKVVQHRINEAAGRRGRDPGAVSVVAISKTQPAQAVREVYALGLRDFGENRVFEGLEKQPELQDLGDLRWHMVGHIQSRKASEIPAHFHIVHSLDRLKIARRLNKHAGEQEKKLPVLLECNVSGEASKYGWELSDQQAWQPAAGQFRSILEMEHVEIRGLMTMAPWVEDEKIIRDTFIKLRNLRDFMQESLGVSWPELSMGMTDDYEIAVEEGATMLRIGRAIFGERRA
ncbi:MAG: YggS family pyridoxal phosphate-dependent enzyme [Anaerolineales bacterium]|nr:YggS family pyridoxal phosphate-dependent enzyme [Anaerolineales bacterium]